MSIKSINDDSNKQVAILFSGGRDSSLAACLYALRGFQIHLLSFASGFGVKSDISNFRHEELKIKFPQNIVSRSTIPIFGLVRRIAVVDIEQDFAKYKTNLILVGEKLAMHSAGIVYCLQHHVDLLADGTSGYQQGFPEQMPEAIALINKFHSEWKIAYETPVLSFHSEDQVKYTLMELGISTKSLEGISMFADSFSKPDPKNLVDYIEDKLPTCRAYIKFLLHGEREYD